MVSGTPGGRAARRAEALGDVAAHDPALVEDVRTVRAIGGKGPAVSSGMTAQLAALLASAVAAALDGEAVAEAPVDPDAPAGPQPTIVKREALKAPKPRALMTWRRWRVPRS
jgi:hypothetical protein